MAEYIYRIKPDLTTVQDIFDTDGIVVWDISHAKNRLNSGDVLYIYICKAEDNQIVFCETETIAYVATVLEVLDVIKTSDTVFKKKVKLKLTALSYHAVQRIKAKKLTKNGYNASQPLTDLQNNSELKDIIDEALFLDDCDIIPVVPETFEDKIINEYETVSKLIDSRTKTNSDKKKLHGNITANILIKYMQAVIDSSELPYKVSPSNSFIDGYGVEWDALIVEKDAVNIMNLNVFEPSRVVAVVEFKTSGLFYKKADFSYDDGNMDNCPVLKNMIDSYKRMATENPKLKLGYISLKESESHRGGFGYITETRRIIDKRLNGKNYSCFNFINTANPEMKFDNQKSWTDFVLSLLP
ncbi:MAG: hypothetical protein IJE48_07230 [Clostridia bacterium]|nr:hypothetical protein [Clostridia bacterium]